MLEVIGNLIAFVVITVVGLAALLGIIGGLQYLSVAGEGGDCQSYTQKMYDEGNVPIRCIEGEND